MTINDTTLLIFKAITNFIHDLNEIYGTQQKSLYLYDCLIERTGIIHEEPIKKHISVFRDFIIDNEDAILQKNVDLMKTWTIQYSDKVFIDMKDIFTWSSESNDQNTLWQHLLTLSALLNPSGQAKEILKQEKTKKGTGGEADFLSGLIDKVSKHVDPTSNPMESMTSLMSSGVFSELMENMNTGLSDGTIDMQGMIGSLQNMIGNLSTMIDETKTQDP